MAGGGGDTATMVIARREFLSTGYFAPIAAALADAADAPVAHGSMGCVVDLGAGTRAHRSERDLRGVISLDKVAVIALTAMGPSAWHARPEATAGLIARLPEPMVVTLAVTVSVLRPRR